MYTPDLYKNENQEEISAFLKENSFGILINQTNGKLCATHIPIELEINADGKEILQLQYEQIIFFEFDFGDDGGTTSWPHIQVNTLRKMEDVSPDQKRLIEEQFPGTYKMESSGEASGCPHHKE